MRFFGILFVLCAVVFSSAIAQNGYTQTKRQIYGLCPPGFTQINVECYYVSDAKASWLDAHFECKDKNSRLAEPMKFADKRLRKYLVAKDKQRANLWIGGTYDWKSQKWQWGHSGKEMKYNSFSANDLNRSSQLEYHCAVLDPTKKYRWSAKLCSERYRFVCQHKMPKVSRRNREKIYSRWNTTYPNQMANEFLLEVTEIQVNGTRKHRRIRPIAPSESIRGKARGKWARNPGQLSVNDVRYPSHLAPEEQTDFSNGAPPETRRLPRTHLEAKPETPANRDDTSLTEFDRRVEFQRRQEYERKQRRRQMHRRKLQREREERARAEKQAKERYELLKKEKELSETHHHQLPPTLPPAPVLPTERRPEEVRPTQQPNIDDQILRTTKPTVVVAETEQPPEIQQVPAGHNEVDNSVVPSSPEEQHRQHLLQLQEEAQKAEEYRKAQISADPANSLYEAERARVEQARRRVEELEKKREEERKLREEIMRKENEELQRLAQEMRERELADRRALEEEEERRKIEEENRQKEELLKVQARAEKRRKAEQRRRLILRKRTEEAERKAKEVQQEAERIRQQKIRERIQNLSPEKRELFFKEREKRQKRRLERLNANKVDNLE